MASRPGGLICRAGCFQPTIHVAGQKRFQKMGNSPQILWGCFYLALLLLCGENLGVSNISLELPVQEAESAAPFLARV